MRQINSTDFKTHLSEFLDLVSDEPITINRSGRPVAVLLSMEQFASFRRLTDIFAVARTMAAKTPGEWISHEEAITELLARLSSEK